MEIILESKQVMTPENMGKALAKADANEFAALWFEFAEECSDEKLEEFAKAMSPTFGGKRKEPFKKLYTLMEYYEFKEKEKSE